MRTPPAAMLRALRGRARRQVLMEPGVRSVAQAGNGPNRQLALDQYGYAIGGRAQRIDIVCHHEHRQMQLKPDRTDPRANDAMGGRSLAPLCAENTGALAWVGVAVKV